MDVARENVEAFFDLEGEGWRRLLDLNRRIQEHKGAWGEWQTPDGRSRPGPSQPLAMPARRVDSLILAFVDLWYAHNLAVRFDWPGWRKGREWYRSTDDRKYAALDASTALKLLTVALRADRFSEGALERAFESGDVPKILNRLVEIRGRQRSSDDIG